MSNILESAESELQNGTMPLLSWGCARSRIDLITVAESEKPWFIVGDLHGDFVAWHHLFEHIRREPDFRVLFLGDLIDRGPHSLECVAALLEAVLNHPNRFLWIMGNHDEGLGINQSSGAFKSSVEPAEIIDELSQTTPWATQDQLSRWGRLLIGVVQRLPRAVVFPDGLLATHGGVPLHDQWEHLKSPLQNLEPLHTERCLRDFTWTRAADKPRSKWDLQRRSQGSSDFQYGFKDLDDFCAKCGELFNGPIKRVVRGHDHVENGVNSPPKFVKTPLLTINGFGFDYLTNDPMKYRSTLALGVYQRGDAPRIESVPVLGPAYELVADSPPPIVSAPDSGGEPSASSATPGVT